MAWSLFDRIRGVNDAGEVTPPPSQDPGNAKITVGAFSGSCLMVIEGTRTRQQIIDAWLIQEGKQQNEFNTIFNWYDAAADKAWYKFGLFELFLVIELGGTEFTEAEIVATAQALRDGPPPASVE